MARPVNRKCQHCATLPVEEAIALHGSEGDNCWNPADCRELGYDCHRRRNHYRHRQDDNQTRRRMRKLQKQGLQQQNQFQVAPLNPSDPDLIAFNPPALPFPYAAVLVLYRRGKDAPVHAVAVEIWQGDRQVKQINPIHCMGMRGNEVTAYIREILEQLHQPFGVSRFEDVIKEMPVEQCPISGCPVSQFVQHI